MFGIKVFWRGVDTGEEDHEFELCPLRKGTPKISKITVEKNSKKATTSTSKSRKETEAETEDEMEEHSWSIVDNIKGKKPLILRKPRRT